MLTSFPHDYPRPNNKKRSLGRDAEPQWTKRTKQHHSSMSWTQSISSSLQATAQQQQQQQHRSIPMTATPVNIMANAMVKKDSVDTMMVDSVEPACYSERIDDMEKYLNDGEDIKESPMTTAGQPIDIYTLLERQHRPLTAMLVNGVLLPMERQQGGTKHCIPEFVLRSPKSTTCSKPSLTTTHSNYLPMETQQFMLGNNDLMDID